jgi:hypothetical protein
MIWTVMAKADEAEVWFVNRSLLFVSGLRLVKATDSNMPQAYFSHVVKGTCQQGGKGETSIVRTR